MRWMFENVYIESDAAGNIKPSKKRSVEKIDGVIGTIMALDGAIRPKKASSGGIVVYDSVTDTTYRDGVPIDDGRDAALKRETVDEKRRRLERIAMFGDDW